MFLDEFGHEECWKPEQCPIFGYGGLIIPGHKLAAFSTQFFDFKITQLRHIYQNRADRVLAGEDDGHAPRHRQKPPEYIRRIAEKMRKMKEPELLRDADVRRLAATYEIKGASIFSASYLEKLNREIARGQRRQNRKTRFLRSIRRFLEIVSENEGQIVYCGFHKSCVPSLNEGERIHVELVKDVLKCANEFAIDNNTTVKIIFDHHQTDEPKFRSNRVGDVFELKTRHDRAQEIILGAGYYENITEPIFNAKSHLSQGVQAADWTAALLKYMLLYRSEGKSQYKEINEALGGVMWERRCKFSQFKTTAISKLAPEQLEFDFAGVTPVQPRSDFLRPYHRA